MYTAHHPATGRPRLPIAALLLTALVGLPGCHASDGPERVAVRGTVTLDGKDLAAGAIRFVPTGANQGPAAFAVIRDGRYETLASDGPVLGPHRVEIEATDYLGFAIDDEATFAAAVRKKARPLPRNPVPEKYNRRSTLQVDIASEGSREFTFDLSSRVSP